MKKIIFLLVLIMSFCFIEAQEPLCPSYLSFVQAHETGRSNRFRISLFLVNESQNLNGYVLTIRKPSSAKWVVLDKSQGQCFTAKGCGKYILARLEGKTDEEREAELNEYCDIKSSVRQNGNLVVVEIIKTPDLFFPVSGDINVNGYDFIPVGEFAIDMSDCEDGKYEIGSSPYEEDCVFSYVGGPEGTQSWIYEYPIVLTLFKKGDLVSIWPDFPLDDYDGVEEVEKAKSVASVNYYNLAGVESAEPFDGLSIKVTTYSDGTRKSEKVVR